MHNKPIGPLKISNIVEKKKEIVGGLYILGLPEGPSYCPPREVDEEPTRQRGVIK